MPMTARGLAAAAAGAARPSRFLPASAGRISAEGGQGAELVARGWLWPQESPSGWCARGPTAITRRPSAGPPNS